MAAIGANSAMITPSSKAILSSEVHRAINPVYAPSPQYRRLPSDIKLSKIDCYLTIFYILSQVYLYLGPYTHDTG